MTTKTMKKATNVSIRSDILTRARELDINLSATLEEALRHRIAEKDRVIWKKENRKAVEAYNDDIRELGLFSAHTRSF